MDNMPIMRDDVLISAHVGFDTGDCIFGISMQKPSRGIYFQLN